MALRKGLMPLFSNVASKSCIQSDEPLFLVYMLRSTLFLSDIEEYVPNQMNIPPPLDMKFK